MMKIITGRAKSGKSSSMFSSVIDHAKIRRQIIIVPETSSHVTERELVKRGGDGICLTAEVFTFRSLSRRIFSEVGGLCENYLEDAGRLLTMRLAVSRMEGSLESYRKTARQPEFLSGLIEFTDEMKSQGILPEDLADILRQSEGILSKRLFDLTKIYTAYCALTNGDTMDPRDRMTKLCDAVKVSRFFDGCDIYIDSFSGFTQQEFWILGEMMKKAESVTIFLTCSELPKEDDTDVFQKPRKTAQKLMRIAKNSGISVEVTHFFGCDFAKTAFSYLEHNLFGYMTAAFDKECGEIQCIQAADPFEECERIAAEIIRLTREEGLRYRDIAVLSRSFDNYSGLLEIVFERYGIPAFFSRKRDILSKPVISLLLSAIDTIQTDFSYEMLFRYLKTGLSGLLTDEIDTLENYVYLWNIEGKMWLDDADWNLNPDGYAPNTEDSDRRLLELNRIKEEVRAPFITLKEALENTKTGGEYAKLLYEFIEDIGLFSAICSAGERLLSEGDRQLADEYKQLFEILVDALSQFYSVLRNEPMETGEFRELFSLLLTGYDVGTIPVFLDAVTLGDVPVCDAQHFNTVFIMGACDGMLPPPQGGSGLLSDSDREELIALGLDLAVDPEMRTFEVDFQIYKMFVNPLSKLRISYPLYMGGEAKQRPAYIVTRLQKLFPKMMSWGTMQDIGFCRLSAEIPRFDLALSGKGTGNSLSFIAWRNFEGRPECIRRIALAEIASNQTRGPIREKDRIRQLYGEEVRMTASKTEKFESCRFSFFMQYGLHAKARKQASFDAPAIGTFFHYILEHTIRELKVSDGGIRSAKDEEINDLIKRFTKDYVDKALFGLSGKSKRFIYLFERLEKSTVIIVKNVVEELKNSLFSPFDFELTFSYGGDLPPVKTPFENGALSLNGKVDRVDGYVNDDTLYLRVVDYKTGKKSFSLSDVIDGLDMQMLLYLFTIEEQGLARYRGMIGDQIKRILPAGILYIPAYEPHLRSNIILSKEEIELKAARELKRSGLILDEMPIIDAMEQNITCDGRFLPVKLNADRKIAALSSVASNEQFHKLKKHIHKTLREMGELISSGNTEANPYSRGPNECVCDFCDYRSACLFDESGPCDKMRVIKHRSREEVWAALEERGTADGC
ncbi:MAG: PD-(D/E)XK nuclease family protein [Clostridiales bacterium]|nr:PD-(D/E)XK nuclease family protein [Clostridiales bacterium]